MSFKLAPTKFHASAKLEVKRLQKPRLITLSLCAQPKYKKDGKQKDGRNLGLCAALAYESHDLKI